MKRKLDTSNHAICLILPLCRVLAIKKKAWLSIVIPSIYIRTLFYVEIEKNKKERQAKIKKMIRRKIYNARFDHTTLDPGGRCSHHCAMENVQFSATLSPIYRQRQL